MPWSAHLAAFAYRRHFLGGGVGKFHCYGDLETTMKLYRYFMSVAT